MRLTHDQKGQIINAIWVNGTLEAALNDTITMESIQTEIKKSSVFKKRVDKAIKESRGMLIDEARALVRDYMRGKYDKTDRNRLTAAIALLNAYEPGFKGTTTVQGRIYHDIEVKSAVPRPKYDELDNPPQKMLKSGKRTKKIIRDEQGNYIGTQTVEEVIEGEVIKESECQKN